MAIPQFIPKVGHKPLPHNQVECGSHAHLAHDEGIDGKLFDAAFDDQGNAELGLQGCCRFPEGGGPELKRDGRGRPSRFGKGHIHALFKNGALFRGGHLYIQQGRGSVLVVHSLDEQVVLGAVNDDGGGVNTCRFQQRLDGHVQWHFAQRQFPAAALRDGIVRDDGCLEIPPEHRKGIEEGGVRSNGEGDRLRTVGGVQPSFEINLQQGLVARGIHEEVVGRLLERTLRLRG